MRYFRIFIVINVLMIGALHASQDAAATPVDGASVEGIAAGEPPQQVVEGADEQSQAQTQPSQEAGEVVSEQAGENKDGGAEQLPAVPLVPAGQEAVIAEPETTIEDVEALMQGEHADEQVIPAPVTEPSRANDTSTGLPEAPKNQEIIIPAPGQEEPFRGIDTVDLEFPRGNWLFKRHWYDRAETTYKKIRVNVEKINDMRVTFFARRTELDKTILDPFYTDIGLSQSELQSSMQTLMTQLEKEREQQGTLSEEERELVDTIQKDRERLKQLERDINVVGGLRDEADKAVDRVMEQKNRASGYEKDAYDEMREIGRIVNDTQASNLYYKMDAEARTVKEITKYVDQELNRHFDTLLSNAREQTERIKKNLQALKEQGVDLKARVQQAQEHDIAREAAAAAAEEDKEKEKKAVPQKTGWFASGSRLFQAAVDVALWQFLQSIWDVIMWLPRRIYGTITTIFR